MKSDIVLQHHGRGEFEIQPQNEQGTTFSEGYRGRTAYGGPLYLGPSNTQQFLKAAEASGLVVEVRG